MLKIAVGHSNDPDSAEAIQDVLAGCKQTLDGHQPKAGVLFAAIDFDHALLLEHIYTEFPNLQLIGGTTDGEVSSVLGFQQDSVVLMLFCSDEVEMTTAVGRHVSQDPEAIAAATVECAKAQLGISPCLCIATPESLTTSASSILDGLKQALGGVPILGGTTADQTRVKQTYQFFNGEVLSDAVPVLLMGGNLLFSYGVSSGWQPIGKRSQVTKVEKNVIYEIDAKPALEFYHYYLNEFAPDVAYPLAIFPPGEEKFFLRGALKYDPDCGSLTVAADVPQNSIIQITEASHDGIVAASKASFEHALQDYPGKEPVAALFFSCAWRRLILGTQTAQEYDTIKLDLAQGLPSCGFYTYGEISPLRIAGPSFFHNTTFVTLLLGSQ
ncbi:MAG TPA: FIST N-terminal domain-containing protein [Stenomitos sp.]